MLKKTILQLVFLTLSPVWVMAQYNNDLVKMGLIRNFGDLITWPDEHTMRTFTVGYCTTDSTKISLFDKLAKTGRIKGKPIVVKNIKNIQEPGELQILYLDKQHETVIENAYNICRDKHILLLTENCKDKQIVMINFISLADDTKVKFEMNKSNVTVAGLEPSPKLLLTGGSEIDIREMYKKSEAESKELKKQLDSQKTELAIQQARYITQKTEIENQKTELYNLQEQVVNQNENIVDQQYELTFLNKRIVTREQELAQKTIDIKKQEQQIAEKEEELEKKKLLEKNQHALSLQQDNELNRQARDIEKQKKILSSQARLISGQQQALQLFIIFSIIVLVLLILIARSFYQKKKLNLRLGQQNDDIMEKSIILEKQKFELQETLENLQNTQTQLIQSEKMASLGQLIAGIAHEINTPIGAIKASVGIISDSTRHSLEHMPLVVKNLTQAEYELFVALISRSISTTSQLNSKEERTQRKLMTATLDKMNIDRSNQIADNLVDMGIYSDIEVFEPLFIKNKEFPVMTHCYEIVQQIKNSANIQLAVDKIAKIVFALKSYAHYGDQNAKVKTNITSGIETVLTLYHNQLKRSITVEKDFQPVPDTYCFPDELNQVWTNIIHNAIHAMKNEGTLKISILACGPYIRVLIKDSGTGIPDEVKSRIFDAFYTTKPAGEGSGLGLHIVKNIIDKHNGEINLESKLGEGTTFIIDLPVVETIA